MSSGAVLALLVTLLVVLTPVPPTAADGNEAPGKPFVTRSITAGSTHTCVLVHSARVKCWGRNNFGQLGLGDTTSRGDGAGEMGDDLPTVNLGTGRTATALTSGESHTCALLDNGTVKCWGKNDVGQLGLGDTASRGDGAGEMGDSLPPVSLGAGRTATAITAGDNHTCARLDNGTVKCWGNNTNGRLGLGDVAARGDAAGEMGDSLPAVDLGTGRTATAITAGSSHTCARLNNFTVKCWGNNASGRLGLGDVAARGDAAGEMGDSLPAVDLGTGRTATAVSAGSGQTCALLDNAAVKCWGANGFGQLGLGDALAHGSGAGEMGDNLPTVDLGTGRTATAITAGVLHTCALLDNGTVKCWGIGVSGQLGLEDVATRGDAGGEMGDSLPSVPLGRDVVAVTAGNSHNCALLDNGDVKCWGNNQFGQLGLGDVANRGDAAGEMGGNLPTIELGGFRTVVAVDAGSAHTCALLDNGSIKCWGENSNGTLGLGSETDRGDAAGEMGDNLPTVNLGTGRTATAITAGGGYTCALLDNATVKCWGENDVGQLGLGLSENLGTHPGEMGDNLPPVPLGAGRTATAIAAGANHTCALLDNATVKCWGLNSHGQLGLGDVATRGDDLGETGDNLPTVDLGTGRTATAITAGANHTCARLDNATLKCWGNNPAGALGLGDTLPRGDAPGEMGDNLPAVDLGTGRTPAAVAAGLDFTCAVLTGGDVKCWGSNVGGRIGSGDTADLGDDPNEMGDNLPPVQLGTGRTATGLSSFGRHTCARLDNGRVKCWGRNELGQLGLGDSNDRGYGSNQMGDNLPSVNLGTGHTVLAVSAGEVHTCARLDNASVKCWGNNGSGRLGLGDTLPRGESPLEMGNALLPIDLGSGLSTGITGTITDAVSGAPVPGAFAAVLRTDDFSLAAGVVADGSGNYDATVPPGDYYLYLVDPTGAHTAAFSGPPTTFVVPADTIIDADGTMAPTRGAVAGTITETGPDTPIAGAWALSINAATGAVERGVVANGSGTYTIAGLNPGNHHIGWIDSSGAHQTRFSPNSVDVPGATPLAVTAGGSTTANGSLPTQTAIGTGTNLTGTLTEAGTGSPLAGEFVLALQSADFKLARGGITNGSGAYTLDVAPGSYYLAFVDTTGLHNGEWHNNQTLAGLAGATSVTAPAVTNATLDRSTGSLSGTVTDDPSGNPIDGAWVLAIGPTGIAGGTTTAPNGTYTISGLPPGTYRATFVDPNGGHTLEYFDNAPDFAGATPFNITAGANLNDLDGFLTLP